ncbi:MAG: peptidylprolyl isomerase [Dehalococcoidia bacterium]
MPQSKRRRRRGPVDTGERKARYPFPVNILFNVKVFYFVFIIVMIASMAAVGLGVSQGSGNKGPGAPITDQTTAPEVTPDVAQWPDGALPVIDATTPHIATLHTNQGDIVIEFSTKAPLTANGFAFLAAKNFFDGDAFFYVDKQYFAQSGDPSCAAESENVCSGLGGPGYTLAFEESDLKHDQWAVVAPALGEGATDMHGSQFRILYAGDSRLDGKETVFGTVVEGRDILEGLSNFSVCSVSTSDDCHDDFADALVIEDVTVEES